MLWPTRLGSFLRCKKSFFCASDLGQPAWSYDSDDSQKKKEFQVVHTCMDKVRGQCDLCSFSCMCMRRSGKDIMAKKASCSVSLTGRVMTSRMLFES